MAFYTIKEVSAAYKIHPNTLRNRLKPFWFMFKLNKRVRLIDFNTLLFIESKLGKSGLIKDN